MCGPWSGCRSRHICVLVRGREMAWRRLSGVARHPDAAHRRPFPRYVGQHDNRTGRHQRITTAHLSEKLSGRGYKSKGVFVLCGVLAAIHRAHAALDHPICDAWVDFRIRRFRSDGGLRRAWVASDAVLATNRSDVAGARLWGHVDRAGWGPCKLSTRGLLIRHRAQHESAADLLMGVQRPAAASTNPVMIGCLRPSSAALSGWNAVPTKKGCPSSAIARTAPSGSRAATLKLLPSNRVA